MDRGAGGHGGLPKPVGSTGGGLRPLPRLLSQSGRWHGRPLRAVLQRWRRIDPLHPEALVYEPTKAGGFRLVAIEYIVIAASWTGSQPPTVNGHPLDFVDSPNEFGLPPFYELHVWLYKWNPRGVFYEWNPRVTCKYAT